MRRSIVLSFVIACGGQQAAPATQTVSLPESPSATTQTPPPPTASTVEASPPPPQQEGGAVVERDVWTNAFEAALPVALCKNGSYFRACFPISQTECEQTMASATRVCTGKVRKQLPLKLHQPDDGTAWGQRIGGCAGTTYDTVMAQKKIHDPKCDDPNAWTTPP